MVAARPAAGPAPLWTSWALALLLCGAGARAEAPAADRAPAGKRLAAAGGDSAAAEGKAPLTDPFAAPVPAAASKAASFEELLREAVPVTDLATLIEPLYARCEDKDDLPRRQCEGMRAFLLDRLRARTFAALADVPPEASPYDAAAKEIELEVSGCIACASPPVVAGEPRVLATRPPQRIVAGRAAGVPLATHQLPMETRVRADRFLERAVPRLRVEHVFRVGQPFGDGQPGKIRGVQVIPVAHRVYDRCTGQVAAASVPSSALKVKPDRSCPQQGSEELSRAELALEAQRAALPERLTSSQVEAALSPLQEKIHDCYVEFQELGGTVKVHLTLSGEGKLTQVGLSPPFDKAAIGVCIKSQIKSATFPKFRGDPMRIDYAFQVN